MLPSKWYTYFFNYENAINATIVCNILVFNVHFYVMINFMWIVCKFLFSLDEVFIRGIETKLLDKSHKRTDSTTTTCSESEFKHEYRLRRKCMVHRHDSQQEYQRMSAKVYG